MDFKCDLSGKFKLINRVNTMRVLLLFCFLFVFKAGMANYIFIPMDERQANHLKAYGIAYWILKSENEVDWLLNYRGGSFMCKFHPAIQNELVIRGVTGEVISDAQANQILSEIASPAMNYDVMKLEKCPKIAVYTPKTAQPWDDAVTLVLSYAEIPYDRIFDDEVLGARFRNMIGFTSTMKISPASMESFIVPLPTSAGTSSNKKKQKNSRSSMAFIKFHN